MAQVTAAAEAGHARYTYRLRVSAAARTAMGAEWDRCRWVWNECVAKSKAVHLHNKATGEKATCGPAQLDRMLTEARARTPWLREGSSVPQQQVIRDFGRSRAKAHKDISECLPMARRAGMPKWKSKREARPTLNYTRRGFRLRTAGCTWRAASSWRWCGRDNCRPSRPRCACARTASGTGTPRSSSPPTSNPCPGPAAHSASTGREGDRDHHVRRVRPPPRPGTARSPGRSWPGTTG